MTTDIALRDTDSWAGMLPAVADLANKISGTSFVPKSLRGKTAETAACILTGREIGIGPMEALAKIHVVEGRPTMSAELMRSLALRAGHELRFPVLSDTKVVAEGRRAGSDSWTTVTWTMEDARRIGLAGKQVWKQYPRQMLSNRATAELCRLLFPDALGGVSYTPDEIEDEQPAPATTVTRAKTTRATVQRQAPPALEPTFDNEPPVEAEPVVEPEAAVDTETGEIVEAEIVEQPAEPMMSSAQSKMMAALMRELGMTDRDDAVRYCVDVIRRDIESRAELTAAEASQIIDSLNADKAAQDAAQMLGAES